MKNLPYGRQSISERDISAVADTLNSDLLTTGPKVSEFESKLCAVTGAKHAFAVANGTAALHLAVLALGVKPGDLGLTSPITFVASANCFEYAGGRSDFIDIDPQSLCMSPKLLEKYCNEIEIPKVVIPVSFAGVPADLYSIRKLSERFGFFVIEDAAHSLGSLYEVQGKRFNSASCVHTDLAILSFHPVKTITTGEGGAILTNSNELAAKLKLYRTHGVTKDPALLTQNDGPWYYQMLELGFNYRLTDIQAALGTSQLSRLEEFKTRRLEIVKRYNEAFAGDKRYILPPSSSSASPCFHSPCFHSPCFHLYTLQFSEGPSKRKAVYEALTREGITAQVHYIPVHTQPYYVNKYGFKEGKCPNAETYYSRCLSLPLFVGLSESDVERVIRIVREA